MAAVAVAAATGQRLNLRKNLGQILGVGGEQIKLLEAGCVGDVAAAGLADEDGSLSAQQGGKLREAYEMAPERRLVRGRDDDEQIDVGRNRIVAPAAHRARDRGAVDRDFVPIVFNPEHRAGQRWFRQR